MSCPYCGLDPIPTTHIETRHGITPSQHAALQADSVPDFGQLGAPAGTELTVNGTRLARVTVTRSEPGGYL